MSEASTLTVAEKLRAPFKPSEVGKLPHVTCPDCSDKRKQCTEHRKERCQVCKSWVSEKHIHIDYVGHADVTSRLLEADAGWSWEPQARDIDPHVLAAAAAAGPDVLRAVLDNAPPKFDLDDRGDPVGLWIRLTVGGTTRPGFGSVPSGQSDAVKVLIGDALRNAAMRFGVAVDLWAKGDRADPAAENATASAGQARRGRQKADESWRDAPPVSRAKPAAAKVTAPANAATDLDWMTHMVDDLIPAATTRKELTGFWTDVAGHVKAGTCTEEHAKQIGAVITERSGELSPQPAAAGPNADPEVDEHGAATFAEQTRMVTGRQPGAERLTATPDDDPYYVNPPAEAKAS